MDQGLNKKKTKKQNVKQANQACTVNYCKNQHSTAAWTPATITMVKYTKKMVV